MKLDELETEWYKDSKIDISDLGNESIKTTQLHQKYSKLLNKAKLDNQKSKNNLAKLLKFKTEYYLGQIDDEILREKNLEPYEKIVLKQELPMHLDADKEIAEAKLLGALYQTKVDFLISVVDSINRRSFSIKSAIDWLKFTNGVS